MNKYKIKVMSIIHITEAINTSRCNVRQAKQIKNSPFCFEEVLKSRIYYIKSLVEFSYLLIDKF